MTESLRMIWALAIAGLVFLAFGAVWLGFVPPPHANTLLHVREGAIRVSRGRLRPEAKEQVTEVLSEAGVTKGFIAVTPGNRVVFSRHIPAAVHQRLRNVLLNQWA